MLGTLKHGAKYTVEFIGDVRNLKNPLGTIKEDNQTLQYLSDNKYVGSTLGMFGKIFYDMSFDDKDIIKRDLIGKTSTRVLVLENLVDDILDKRPEPLETKFNFLNNVESNLFGRSFHSSQDSQKKIAYSLADSVHRNFLSQYDNSELQKISNKLSGAVKTQFVEEDKDELLEIAKTIGACSLDASAVLTEIMAGGNHYDIRKCARKLGEYAELVDHCYEIDEDLAEGNNTYATIMIGEEGDGPSVRKKIKQHMLAIANESVADGFENLDEENKDIYRLLKILTDLNYNVIDRLPEF